MMLAFSVSKYMLHDAMFSTKNFNSSGLTDLPLFFLKSRKA